MMEIRELSGVSDAHLAECFNQAFADYAIPLRLSESDMRGVMERSGVEPALSAGAFEEGCLVGFVLNSCGMYCGGKAAFMVAAGVVPERRGQGVFSRMLAFAESRLCACGARRYCLEVLQKNEKAIALYRRAGFSVSREFAVLRAASGGNAPAPEGVSLVPYAGFEPDVPMVEPSYEHSEGILRRHAELYRVATSAGAFCVHTAGGHILQLGCSEPSRLAPVLACLQASHPELIAKNIDSSQTALLDLLSSLGFREITSQYEMSKPL